MENPNTPLYHCRPRTTPPLLSLAALPPNLFSWGRVTMFPPNDI